MAAKRGITIVTPDQIERCIQAVRGQRVILDEDLAKLYGVSTTALNQAVRRNLERFPEDFAFQLTLKEFTALMSQFVTSNVGRGGRRKLPWVFTEQGVAMLSSVLRSPTAIRVNIEIMRTFVRLRRLLTTPGELVEQVTKLAEAVRLHDGRIKAHDEQIRAVLEALRKLMEPPQPKGRIGFQAPPAPQSGSESGNP